METEEVRRARLEKYVATKRLMLAMEREEERRGKKGMYLISIFFLIEIDVFKN